MTGKGASGKDCLRCYCLTHVTGYWLTRWMHFCRTLLAGRHAQALKTTIWAVESASRRATRPAGPSSEHLQDSTLPPIILRSSKKIGIFGTYCDQAAYGHRPSEAWSTTQAEPAGDGGGDSQPKKRDGVLSSRAGRTISLKQEMLKAESCRPERLDEVDLLVAEVPLQRASSIRTSREAVRMRRGERCLNVGIGRHRAREHRHRLLREGAGPPSEV